MTPIEALKQAQKTGQIAISKQSANLIEALENFFNSAENLTTAIADNMPVEMGDNETINEITTQFYTLLDPAQEFVLETIGKINLKRALLYGRIDSFEGL